jgi:hypothetical protein
MDVLENSKTLDLPNCSLVYIPNELPWLSNYPIMNAAELNAA